MPPYPQYLCGLTNECPVMLTLLKFPPILGGDYGAGTWIMLLVIVALVVGVLYAVFRLLGQENAE